jgi:hypothetical protein
MEFIETQLKLDVKAKRDENRDPQGKPQRIHN